LKLSYGNSLKSFEKLINAVPQSAIGLLTDVSEKALATKALSKGAIDYLVKSIIAQSKI
jgi:ActR/RegA family two-component response regulator